MQSSTASEGGGGATTLAVVSNADPCRPACSSLVEALRRAAAELPDRRYLDLLDSRNRERWLTHGEVLRLAEAWGAHLTNLGLEAGERVVLLLPAGRDFVGAFFGTLLAGGIPTPLACPAGPGDTSEAVLGLLPVVHDAAPAVLITTPACETAARALARCAALRLGIVLPGQVPAAPGRAPRFPEPAADQLCLLQYASGPLGEPAGVELTHAQVLCNIEGLGRALSLGPDDVAVNWVPLTHDMGLVGGLLSALYWRMRLHVMPPQAFLMRPHLWLENLSRFRGTVAVAPNAGYQLCLRRVRDRHLRGLDLRRWRAAVCGGEKVWPGTLQALAERLGGLGLDPAAPRPMYGLAENTLATTCPPPGTAWRSERAPGAEEGLVSLGRPLAGQELAVVDEQGVTRSEREVGQIRVRGPSVMRGLRGRAGGNPDRGWLRTGDLGFISGGDLFITGRERPMLIKMGRNVFFDDIERVVGGHASAAAGRVMAAGVDDPGAGTESLVLLLERARPPQDEQKLRAELNAALLCELGVRIDQLVVVPPATIPGGAGSPAQRRDLALRHIGGTVRR